MSSMRHEVANDGLAIFDLRFNAGFRKRLAGYDRKDVEVYIRRQDAVIAKIRLEKEQLERQLIRIRQQLNDAKDQLAEAKDELARAISETERARSSLSMAEVNGKTINAAALTVPSTGSEAGDRDDGEDSDGDGTTPGANDQDGADAGESAIDISDRDGDAEDAAVSSTS